MIPITYNYTCSCGYTHTQQENIQHGAYLRLAVDVLLLCPECKKSLKPTITVTYAPRQSDSAPSEEVAEQTPSFTSEQIFTFLDRIPAIMEELDHLSGDRALGRYKALYQLDGAIAQVKNEIREPGKDHRKYLTLEDLQ